MGRKNHNAYIKKLKAEKKRKKQEEKRQNKEEKKGQETSGDLQDMIAYVDEFGNISETPPEEEEVKPIKKDKNKPEIKSTDLDSEPDKNKEDN